MNTMKMNKETAEKVLRAVQNYWHQNYGGFNDTIEDLFPGIIEEGEKRPGPFEIEWKGG